MTAGRVTAGRRHEVWLVNLDATVGAEIRNARPPVVVAPDETHRDGEVVLNQLRVVDKERPVRRVGRLDEAEGRRVLDRLGELSAPWGERCAVAALALPQASRAHERAVRRAAMRASPCAR